MCNNHGPDESLLHPQEGTISPYRPPQFNSTNCNYKCGWGCEKAVEENSGGEGSEDGSVKTYVNSDTEESPFPRDHSGGLDSRTGGNEGGQTSVVVLENGDEDQHMSQLSFNLSGNNNELADSLEVGSCTTDDHSSGTSGRASVGIISPGPGIGGWTEGNHNVKFPPAYLFLHSPLRLSHQHEHCRGDTASHLVAGDRPHIFHALAGVWRGYSDLPGFERALWQQFAVDPPSE